MNDLYIVISITVITALLSLIGIGITMSAVKKGTDGYSIIMLFVGGILFSMAIFELIPESIHHIGIISTILYLLMGTLILLLLNYVISILLKGIDREVKVSILLLFGIVLHRFPEGLMIGLGLGMGTDIGIDIAIATAVHMLPETIVISAPIKKYNQITKKSVALMVSALVLPITLGASIGLFANDIIVENLGMCYGISAGIILYLFLVEIIPHSFNKNNIIIGTIALMSGIGVGFFLL